MTVRKPLPLIGALVLFGLLALLLLMPNRTNAPISGRGLRTVMAFSATAFRR